MPAHEKVSSQQITNALLKWRGKVEPAAQELGISRNGLANRIKALGLDLAGFRMLGKVVTTTPTITPFTTFDPGDKLRPKKSGANFQGLSRAPYKAGVSSAVAELRVLKRRQPIRIPPDYLDMLTQAKYDLQALLRRDVTEQEIFELFMKQGLAAFLEQEIAARKREAAEPSAGERPRGRGKDRPR